MRYHVGDRIRVKGESREGTARTIKAVDILTVNVIVYTIIFDDEPYIIFQYLEEELELA